MIVRSSLGALRSSREHTGRRSPFGQYRAFEDLLFKEDGTPIRSLQYPRVWWRRTLTVTLKSRYREPYNARHSSVTWNLMIGRNPLKVP